MNISNILISQPCPSGASPYTDIAAKYGVNFEFSPFFKVEGVSLRDFISQKVSVLDYSAIVFTSRTAIDSFFTICEQSRITVPETMKYFCQSETIAVYLQKYIVYRKRRIFFGSGTMASMLDIITSKHKTENILITCTDSLKPEVKKLFTKAKLKHGSVVLVRTVYNDLKTLDFSKYQMMVFYSPNDVKSLFESQPEFKQEGILFATYGPSTAKAMKDAKLKVALSAPTPEAPSIAEALNNYLSGK